MKRRNHVLTASIHYSLCFIISCTGGASLFAQALVSPKTGPKSAMYVEVNGNNFQNVQCYTLQTGGQQLFDLGIIFAANINYNASAKKAVFYANPNVQKVLSGRSTYIQPLQAKGIKVSLCILGNHQGAGISNFTSRSAARAFAQQLVDVVDAYKLDGIDFDDEYADYGANGTAMANDSSFVILLIELRSLLPAGKLLSFYYYGDAIYSLTYKGIQAGFYLDYSWNAIYGSFNPPAVPGMGKSQFAPAAIDVDPAGPTNPTSASNLAKRTVDEGYGWCLFYDLPNTSI
jgi:Glycosyl hydrolases family 18